jgi:membrane protein implicated in regulation of membrane protease activity
MILFAIYLLLGIVACSIAASTRDKFGRRDPALLAPLLDPLWPLILLWPLWLIVILVERTIPPPAPSQEAPLPTDPIGQTGIAVTELRPTGRIQIGSAHFDAKSDGRIIAAGARVRVLSRSMAELIVEAETPGFRDL